MMELLETLKHLVQSFLTKKEAARTTLLSKSWRAAWSTRPTIDLDESDMPKYYDDEIDGLTVFAKKTFRRYEESNLTIHTFSLCLKNKSYHRHGFAVDWTLKALKLGATDLTLRFPNGDVDNIPLDQVFGNENVQRLCLQGVNIDRLKVIKCTRLKSLTLSNLNLKTNQFFDIMSCFPLIEYLFLSDIRSSSSNEQQVVRSSPSTIIFPKLRSLVLSGFESQFQMKTLFLDDLSSKLPNLKDLTLGFNSPNEDSYQPDDQVIRNISSGTLETLNLRYVDNVDIEMYNEDIDYRENVARFKLDVQSVRKFTFESLGIIPKLRFSPPPAPNRWVSHVSITNPGILSITWFRQLSELLTKLKGSKIHLCIHMHYNITIDYEVGEINGLNVLEVEDLTLDTKDLPSLTCYALLDALFRMCHPKIITQYDVTPVNDDGDLGNNRNNDVFICRSIEQAMQVKSVLFPTQFMYGLRDLEELDAQQLIDGVWRRQHLGSILDDSTSEQRRFRLQLKWKPSRNQYTSDDDDDDDMP